MSLIARTFLSQILFEYCSSLVSYRTCLLDTAKRMHCGEIAGKVAVVVEEQMKKLGMAFCAASCFKPHAGIVAIIVLVLARNAQWT